MKQFLVFTEFEYIVFASIAVFFIYGWKYVFGVLLLWIFILRLCDHFWIPIPSINLHTRNVLFACRGHAHRDGKVALTGPDPAYAIFGMFHRIGGPAFQGRFYLFGGAYLESDYEKITTGRTELEIAWEVYKNPQWFPTLPPANRQRMVIEQFLEMRGEKKLLQVFQAAVELE